MSLRFWKTKCYAFFYQYFLNYSSISFSVHKFYYKDTMSENQPKFFAAVLESNYESIAQIRTMCSLLSGMAAGILGLTGIFGLLFFIVSSAIASFVILTVGCRGSSLKYFPKGPKELFTFESMISGGMTYILAWIVAYDAIYIF
ncbi:unnamed protein product [Phytomonas sp. Hart1]|nr:unnamed protein product [Phytomonas sp. Hart1]|eukprot:CCW68389.1 unnamed protein product [Phytomonas sp. isolate Hart1]